MELLTHILGAITTVILAFVVGMTYGGLVRKITARVQNRKGPPWYQNFIDAFKLFGKTTAIHHGWMQIMGPAFLMVSSVVTLMFIPVLTNGGWFPNLNFEGDLIFLLYLMVFGPLGLALGAGQTGNPNSAIGGNPMGDGFGGFNDSIRHHFNYRINGSTGTKRNMEYVYFSLRIYCSRFGHVGHVQVFTI